MNVLQNFVWGNKKKEVFDESEVNQGNISELFDIFSFFHINNLYSINQGELYSGYNYTKADGYKDYRGIIVFNLVINRVSSAEAGKKLLHFIIRLKNYDIKDRYRIIISDNYQNNKIIYDGSISYGDNMSVGVLSKYSGAFDYGNNIIEYGVDGVAFASGLVMENYYLENSFAMSFKMKVIDTITNKLLYDNVNIEVAAFMNNN
ncbi:hypothetical protein ACILE2_01555 [Capnocytophaga canimorsus]|uniref:hypothetical protein n=1 Tax=Capnocytophaga canimorsus TaxID=28188 RepID=UPI0037D42A18